MKEKERKRDRFCHFIVGLSLFSIATQRKAKKTKDPVLVDALLVLMVRDVQKSFKTTAKTLTEAKKRSDQIKSNHVNVNSIQITSFRHPLLFLFQSGDRIRSLCLLSPLRFLHSFSHPRLWRLVRRFCPPHHCDQG